MTEKGTVTQALANRRSIRAFRPDPVPEPLLNEVIETALLAPSWGNVQPYRVAVASGNTAKEIAAELTARFNTAAKVQRAGLFAKFGALLKGGVKPDGDYNTIMKYPTELGARYRETGHGLYGTLGIERGDKAARHAQMARNFSFFGAPTALFVFCEDSLGAYAALDTGIFMQSLALAAEERGLGTCMQAALATWASPVKARFEIPENYKLICGISIGYKADDKVNSFAPKRRPLDEVLLKPKR